MEEIPECSYFEPEVNTAWIDNEEKNKLNIHTTFTLEVIASILAGLIILYVFIKKR